MKRLPWIFLFISFSITCAGQHNSDYGVFAGVSSYLGDINPNRLLYSPLPAGGIFYRYNFHPRYSLRGNLFFGGLHADDHDFNNSFQQTRGASFSGVVGDISAQFEFNFFPYATTGKRWNFSPYFAAGTGLAIVSTSSISYQPVIPFSFGFKVNIYKNMGLEAEYGFRKTFYDNFDGLKDMVAPSDYAWLHNNDWYTFTGIAFTWKIYNQLAGCPAFNDVDKKKKRK
jgi:hypothetical protein